MRYLQLLAVHYNERLLGHLKRAEQATQAAKTVLLKPFGLTPAGQNVLAVVNESPGITGAELARRVLVTPQTITSNVNRLQHQGLIQRSTHPVHRTLIELSLTDEGRRVFQAADAAVDSYDKRLRAALDRSELATLQELLARVRVAAENDIVGP